MNGLSGDAQPRHGWRPDRHGVDTGGVPVFYAENLQGKEVSWNGVLGALDVGAFRASDFEVLALPPLTRAP